MIEAGATVIATEPGYAWVETRRESACGHCATAGGCGVSVLGKALGTRPDRLRLPDPLSVQTGERVVIGIPEERLLAAAFRAYMVPLLCMLGAALAGAQLEFSQWGIGFSGLAALAAGLGFSGAGMRDTDVACRPVMLRRSHDGEQGIEVKVLGRSCE
jgi:sigma-E factor negative regulatory protein RseC